MLQLYGPATTDPAGAAFSDGRACTMVHVSALNRRIHLVSHRKRYFVMQPGLQLLLFTHVYVVCFQILMFQIVSDYVDVLCGLAVL